MKNNVIVTLFAGLLLCCNSSEKSNRTVKESTTTKNIEEIPLDKSKLVAIDSDEALIATALMSAPEKSRANCKVIGYNTKGEIVTLREGDNEFIVLADDPEKPGFSAACYHRDLEPFMARGRALKAEGKSASEIFDIREEEVKSGKLEMGKPGSTLHIYFGFNELYNPETSVVEGAQYRYVVYLPFATSESTGLPEQPVSVNHPWIMNPGTHKAHIMISPISSDKTK